MKAPQFTVRFLLGSFVLVALIFGMGRNAFFTLYQAYVENFTFYVLEGPCSPDGYRVFVKVTDNSPGFSTCFFAWVYVRDNTGEWLVWVDANGQGSAQGVRDLVASMRWEDRSTLVFYVREYPHQDAALQKVVRRLRGNAGLAVDPDKGTSDPLD